MADFRSTNQTQNDRLFKSIKTSFSLVNICNASCGGVHSIVAYATHLLRMKRRGEWIFDLWNMRWPISVSAWSHQPTRNTNQVIFPQVYMLVTSHRQGRYMGELFSDVQYQETKKISYSNGILVISFIHCRKGFSNYDNLNFRTALFFLLLELKLCNGTPIR